MDNKQAAALVIENIAMLEEAKRLLEGEVTEKVFNALDQAVKAWVESRNDWQGVFNCYEDQQYFGIKDWLYSAGSPEEGFFAWFAFDHNDLDSEWWLTSVLGSRNSIIGFRFFIERSRLPATPGKKAWKSFASQMNQDNPKIELAGFQFEPSEGTWFLPWKLDAKLLAENYVSDSIEDALDPVREALKKIEVIHPTFVKIVEAAQQQFGPIQEPETSSSEA
jgi:hypothetical protein